MDLPAPRASDAGGLALGDLIAATAAKRKEAEEKAKGPEFNFEVHGKQLLFAKRSLFLFEDTNIFRKWVVWLAMHPVFDAIVLLLILANSIVLALTNYAFVMADGSLDTSDPRNRAVEDSELIFTSLFAVEMVLKVIAMGFVLGRGTYIRDPWNVLDFVVVMAGLLALVPGMPNVSALRVIRVLRPLRSLTIVPGMKLLVMSLLRSIPALLEVLMLLLFAFAIFGILGVQLWSGVLFSRCRLTEAPIRAVGVVGGVPSECILPGSDCADLFLNNASALSAVAAAQEALDAGLDGAADAYREIGVSVDANLGMRVATGFNSTGFAACLPGVPVEDAAWSLMQDSAWNTPRACFWPVDPTDERVCTLNGWGEHHCGVGRFCGSNYDSVGNARFSSKEVMDNAVRIGALNFGLTNFNHIAVAVLTIFQSISTEGWVVIMYMVMDAYQGVLAGVYFVILIMFGSFFLLNLLLAVIWEQFSAGQKQLEEDKAKQIEKEREKDMEELRRLGHIGEDGEATPGAPPRTPPLSRGEATAASGGAGADSGSDMKDAPGASPVDGGVGMGEVRGTRGEWRESARLDDGSDPKVSRSGATSTRAEDGGEDGRGGAREQQGGSSGPTGRVSRKVVPVTSSKPVHSSTDSTHRQQAGAAGQATADASGDPTGEASKGGGEVVAISPDHEQMMHARHLAKQLEEGVMTPDQVAAEMHRMTSMSQKRKMGECRHYFYQLATSPVLNFAVMVLILVNTGVLAADHHPMDPDTAFALETINFVLTIMFAMELIVKVVGLGPYRYAKDPFNAFDAIIVLTTLVEIALLPPAFLTGTTASSNAGGGLSALRTFRLFRVFALAKSWTSLRVLLQTILRTLKDIANFAVLLLIFMFVFSLLGMQFFANQMCFDGDAGLPNPEYQGIAGCPAPNVRPRAHFDDLLWAFVTVFQVLSSEDWNVIMYDCWLATGPVSVLYFLTLVIVGDYMVLNLFLAILLGNFEGMEELAKDPETSSSRTVDDSADLDDTKPGILRRLRGALSASKAKVAVAPLDAVAGGRLPARLSTNPEFAARTAPPIVIGHTNATAGGSPTTIPPVRLAAQAGRGAEAHASQPAAEAAAAAAGRTVSHAGAAPTSGPSPPPLPPLPPPGRAGSGGITRSDDAPPLDSLGPPMTSDAGAGSDTGEDPESGAAGKGNRPSHGNEQTSDSKPVDGLVKRVGFASVDAVGDSAIRHRAHGPSQGGANSEGGAKIAFSQLGKPGATVGGHASLSMSGMRSANLSPTDSIKRRGTSGLVESISSITAEPSTVARLRQKKRLYGNALCLIPPTNPWRQQLAKLVQSERFETVILVLIVASSVLLAIDNPLNDPESTLVAILSILDIVFTAAFTVEMILKVLSFGFAFHKNAYLRDPWNILDFIIVVVSLIAISTAGNRSLNALRTLRTLRALRPLRMIARNPGMRLVVNALISSMPAVLNVLFVCILFFLIFGILGVSYFKGTFNMCQGDDFDDAPDEVVDLIVNPRSLASLSNTTIALLSEALAPAALAAYNASSLAAGAGFTGEEACKALGFDWALGVPSTFDNILAAMGTLLEMSTTEGWLVVLYAGVDARGIGAQPVENHSPAWAFFFVAFIVVGNFFVLNLFVGVVIDNFNRMKLKLGVEAGQSILATPEQREWQKTRKYALMIRPFAKLPQPRDPTRRLALHLVKSAQFEWFIVGCILANTLAMAISFFAQPSELTLALETINYVFAAIFTVEAILKLIALGCRYFSGDPDSSWNVFDFVIVVLTDAGIVLQLAVGVNVGSVAAVVRAFRIGRVFRLVQRAKKLKFYFSTLIQTLPSLGNIGGLMFLLFFIYAVMGVQLFADVRLGEYLSDNSNFQSFGMALLTLMRCSTGEAWNFVMYEAAASTEGCRALSDVPYEEKKHMCGYNLDKTTCVPVDGCGNAAAFPFFYSFTVCVTFVFLNLFIAVVLEAFGDSSEEEAMKLQKKDFSKLADAWLKFDPEATCLMPASKLPDLMRELPPPLGFPPRVVAREVHLRRAIRALRIQIHRPAPPLVNASTGSDKPVLMVHFADVAQALATRVLDEAAKSDGKPGFVPPPPSKKDAREVSRLFGRETLRHGTDYDTEDYIAASAIEKLFKAYKFRKKIDSRIDDIQSEPGLPGAGTHPAFRSAQSSRLSGGRTSETGTRPAMPRSSPRTPVTGDSNTGAATQAGINRALAGGARAASTGLAGRSSRRAVVGGGGPRGLDGVGGAQAAGAEAGSGVGAEGGAAVERPSRTDAGPGGSAGVGLAGNGGGGAGGVGPARTSAGDGSGGHGSVAVSAESQAEEARRLRLAGPPARIAGGDEHDEEPDY